jgi:hypothetical protein
MSRSLSLRRAGMALLLSTAGFLRAAVDPDIAVLERMQQQGKAIQAKIIETDDLNERAKLQAQLMTVMDEALKQLSPQKRPLLAVSLKVVRPLQEQSSAYLEAVSAFFTSAGDFRTLKVRTEIKEREKRVDQLEAMNQALVQRMSTLESDVEKMLVAEGVDASGRRNFMEGFRTGTLRKMAATRAVRTLDSRLYAQWKAALALCDEQWGKFRSVADAQITFDDPAAGKKFDAIMAEVEKIADRQAVAEKAAAGL